MLKQPADYPHIGSTCFLSPHGEEARILQQNADGTALVALQRQPRDRTASTTRTVAPTDHHATLEAAIGKKPVTRGRGSRARSGGSAATAKKRKAA